MYQGLAFEHKTNKSSAKVLTHYQIIDLYSEDVCYDILVTDKFFDFFRNVLNTNAIKVCHTITSCMQNYPVNSY